MPGYVEGKDKNEILTALVGTGQPGSPVHEQQKMGIIVRCTEDIERALRGLEESVHESAQTLGEALHSLEKSMNNNALSSDKLAAKLHWLNLLLVVATTVGAIVAVAGLFFGK